MFAVSSIRHLLFLGLRPCFYEAFLSGTLKQLKDVRRASSTLVKIQKPRSKLNWIFIRSNVGKFPPYSSTSSANQPTYAKSLNAKLSSFETTRQCLQFFENVKSFTSTEDKVRILFKMSKIANVDGKQKELLQKEHNIDSSAYTELLDDISNKISECNSWSLANLMWALGKMPERDHKVVGVCEKEILLRGIASFNANGICQIVNGCSNLNLTTSDVFIKLQDAILNKEVKVKDLINIRELSGILLSFSKTDDGFVEVFHVFLKEILSRDFSQIDTRGLVDFVWAFAKKEIKAGKLFSRVEEEFLRRGVEDFTSVDIGRILWAFGMAQMGSKQFFHYLDHKLLSHDAGTLDNTLLLQIVWSFTKRKVTQAKVFDIVEGEVYKRGIHTFKIHELVLILFSFVSAKRYNVALVAQIEGELCSRDAKQFKKGDLSQIAWSLGRAGKSKSQLFHTIETEIFQRDEENLPSKERHMLMLMRGFVEANRGTKKLFEFFAGYFCRMGFQNLHERGICECAWCFSNSGIDTREVFDILEKEICQHNKYAFNDSQIAVIRKSFQKAGKGDIQLHSL